MIEGLRVLVGLLSGLVFGFGLSLSGMVDPARVRGFLDVTGDWDPSLVFVLGGAVVVATIGYRLSLRLQRPALDDRFHLPTKATIDAPLLIGSAIFGAGWGLAGLCPGPAVASLTLGLPPTFLFVAAMLVAMIVHDRLLGRIVPASRPKGTR
ncbi:hypothetical protein SAMN05519103_08627 [Rhizobiales bacterium GAS113]|nr:hypothetical protein SAMN05519103_08627 [Rhizobiales bacterium GAS113]